MTKFATTNADGVPTGFYDPEVNPLFPDGAIEITDAQWKECIDNKGRRAIDTSGGEPVVVAYTPPDPPLADVEDRCLQQIDIAASAARARFISSGVGQEAVYLSKYEEARAYRSASSPTDSDYPYLNAEAGRRNMTVSALADEVIARRNEWTDPPGCTIEAERVGGKDDVRAASTVDDKRAAADAAIATLEAVQPQ